MSKDPAARYASAQELSEDLGRFLHGQPVIARTPSIGYVLAKTARRHRAVFAAGAVSIAALVAALAISLWQIRVAVAERDRARQRFDDARQLSNALIFKIHDGVKPLPGSTPVRQMIVAEALTYLERLSHDPAGDDALRLDLARAYHRIADVQGKPTVANLGDRPGAQRGYERAIALIRPIRNPALVRAAAVELAQLDISLALVLGARDPEARARVNEAIHTAEGLVQANPSDGPARRLLGSTHFQLALMLDDADALPEWKKTGEIFEALLAEQPGDADRQRNVALVQKYIASHYEMASDYASALPYYTRALALDDQRLAGHPADRLVQFDVAVDLSSTGLAKRQIGRLAEAAADLERCLAIRAQLAASDSKDVLASGKLAMAHERLGQVYADLNRLPDALDELHQAVTIAESLASIDAHQQLALTEYLEVLASIEGRARHTSTSCQGYRRALQLTTSLLKRHDLDSHTERLAQDRRARVNAALASCDTGGAK
jgi:non-specific serine/threonine protein kinase/serine/threonine-protein kinase